MGLTQVIDIGLYIVNCRAGKIIHSYLLPITAIKAPIRIVYLIYLQNHSSTDARQRDISFDVKFSRSKTLSFKSYFLKIK